MHRVGTCIEIIHNFRRAGHLGLEVHKKKIILLLLYIVVSVCVHITLIVAKRVCVQIEGVSCV